MYGFEERGYKKILASCHNVQLDTLSANFSATFPAIQCPLISMGSSRSISQMWSND